MLDLTVIILTYNEELHIKRCIENVKLLAKRIVLIDCYSIDNTKKIALALGAEVVEHEWPGNQAAQYNWAIDNINIQTEWVLRIDADEYLLPELAKELAERVPTLDKNITGIELKRRHIFMGKWVRHGGYPTVMMRMYRNGYGRYDTRLMDEHLALKAGCSIMMENDFCDHSLINISDYCRKHLDYAQREAASVLNDLYELSENKDKDLAWGRQANQKHKKKGSYNKLPLFWRSFAYFVYRYFVNGLILDGKQGFLFAFIQGWWYRTMVDAKIFECMKALGIDRNVIAENNKRNMRNYILKNWNIKL